MQKDMPAIRLLRYSQEAVEQALKQGKPFHFESAQPTLFDEFFALSETLGVQEGIELLTDPRKRKAFIPLPTVCNIAICRFLAGLESFRRVGKILLRNHALLQRFGVLPIVAANGGYYQCERNGEYDDPDQADKLFDEESVTKLLARLDAEELNGLLVRFVQGLRRRQPQLFRRGLFVVDSNHFRLKGSREEYKWCALMLWTPYGLIPVAAEFSATEGEGTGETSVGRKVVQRALDTYGEGFIKTLLMDTGYLDGPWLHWLKYEHEIDWMIDPRDDMKVTGGMLEAIPEKPQRPWVQVAAPKLELPQEQLPVRKVMWMGERRNFFTYGEPVNGCVIWDHYSPREGYPQGHDHYQCLLTSRMDWKGAKMHDTWRRRWGIENTFGAMTDHWGLGKWEIGRYAVYQATILFMALAYGLLVAYLYEKQLKLSLRGIADRLVWQADNRMLLICDGAAVVVTPPILNSMLAKGLLRMRDP